MGYIVDHLQVLPIQRGHITIGPERPHIIPSQNHHLMLEATGEINLQINSFPQIRYHSQPYSPVFCYINLRSDKNL